MSSPINIDLFPNDDVICWSGETDDCKEIVLPRNSDLFPNSSRKSYLLKRGNRYFGETGSSAASVPWLVSAMCQLLILIGSKSTYKH